MTKAEYVDWIRHRLSGGRLVSSQFRKFHPKVVAIAIEQALEQVMQDVYKKDPTQLDLYAKTFSAQSVSYDSTLKQFKVDMPASIVKISNYDAIRWVVDENYPNENLVPMTRQDALNLGALYIDRHDDLPFFYPTNNDLILGGFKETAEITTGSIVSGTYYLVDGDDVTYDGTIYSHGEIFLGTAETDFTGDGEVWSFEKIDTVAMGLVISFSSLENTDEVIIPSGKNQEVLAHIFRYFDMPLQDLVNDSKSNPT